MAAAAKAHNTRIYPVQHCTHFAAALCRRWPPNLSLLCNFPSCTSTATSAMPQQKPLLATWCSFLPSPGFLFSSCGLHQPCPPPLCTPLNHQHGCRHPILLAAHSLSSYAALTGELWVDRLGGFKTSGIKCSKPFVCICTHPTSHRRTHARTLRHTGTHIAGLPSLR